MKSKLIVLTFLIGLLSFASASWAQTANPAPGTVAGVVVERPCLAGLDDGAVACR